MSSSSANKYQPRREVSMPDISYSNSGQQNKATSYSKATQPMRTPSYSNGASLGTHCSTHGHQPGSQSCMAGGCRNAGISSGVESESIYASPRLGEKQELIALNARLSQYVRHMREMKENSGYVDSKVFMESVRVLEEELIKLRAMYEQELDQTRIQVDDISRAKTHYEMEEKKAKSLAAELRSRLEIEIERSNKRSVEINSLQRQMAQKDLIIEEGRIALQTPAADLEKLDIEYQQLRREYEHVKKRFEKEVLMRQDSDDKYDTLRKKLDFQTSVFEQERTEMQARLTSANNTILALEEKVREMSHHDSTLVDMLKRVRESAEAELHKYQQESEERHSRHLTELKAQIDEDDRRIMELTNEVARLNDTITILLGQIRELEGQNQSLDHQLKCYVEMLGDEKTRASEHIRKMEFKQREMQEVLVNKMHELNASKDSQISLKTEIDSFRVLIEEEERRLRLNSSTLPDLPVLTPSYRKEAFAAANAATLVPQPAPGSSKTVRVNSHGYMESNPAPKPLGPIKLSRGLNLVPAGMGQGTNYCEEMFKDLKLPSSHKTSGGNTFIPAPPSVSRSSQRVENISTFHSEANSCSTGGLKLELDSRGKYVRVMNTGDTMDEEIGGYMIKQNIGGYPVAVFRFPLRTRILANEVVTVWSGDEDRSFHQPPTDFVAEESQQWGTGTDRTTIICKPDGTAVSWQSGTQRITRDAYSEGNAARSSSNVSEADDNRNFNNNNNNNDMAVPEEQLQPYDMNVNAVPAEAEYIRRNLEPSPTLAAPKHPHGTAPLSVAHPSKGDHRAKTYGNDNSSVNRQSRVQPCRPDPITGAPYAGPASQKMGGASLKKQPPFIKGNNSRANKAATAGTITSPTPSTFQTPRKQIQTGLEQIRSQHHMDFNPPMPRPPLFSAW